MVFVQRLVRCCIASVTHSSTFELYVHGLDLLVDGLDFFSYPVALSFFSFSIRFSLSFLDPVYCQKTSQHKIQQNIDDAIRERSPRSLVVVGETFEEVMGIAGFGASGAGCGVVVALSLTVQSKRRVVSSGDIETVVGTSRRAPLRRSNAFVY